MEATMINWPAIILGVVVAFALGMLWYSPKMFGKVWASGSHGLKPPESAPIAAMTVQFLGSFALALVVGITATTDALITAILAIFAAALLVAGSGMFGQKTTQAVLVDFSYIIVSGVIFIAAQGLL